MLPVVVVKGRNERDIFVLQARVLSTAGNASLLEGLLPAGVAWRLDTASVAAFSMPRVRIKWSLRAWLASLPTWALALSAAAGAACCAAGVGACLRRRQLLRRGKARVGAEEAFSS